VVPLLCNTFIHNHDISLILFTDGAMKLRFQKLAGLYRSLKTFCKFTLNKIGQFLPLRITNISNNIVEEGDPLLGGDRLLGEIRYHTSFYSNALLHNGRYNHPVRNNYHQYCWIAYRACG